MPIFLVQIESHVPCICAAGGDESAPSRLVPLDMPGGQGAEVSALALSAVHEGKLRLASGLHDGSVMWHWWWALLCIASAGTVELLLHSQSSSGCACADT